MPLFEAVSTLMEQERPGEMRNVLTRVKERLAEGKGLFTPALRLFFLVGFLGAFTTFSSLTWESWDLMRAGLLTRSLVNMGANLLLGFAALLLGVLAARALS